jgi:hypothetical protein
MTGFKGRHDRDGRTEKVMDDKKHSTDEYYIQLQKV